MPYETINTDLGAGEIGRSAVGRVDSEGYARGAEKLRNVTVKVQGGVQTRPGMRWFPFTGNADPSRPVRAWAFEFDVDERYMIVAHAGAVHVFRADGAFEATVAHAALTDAVLTEMQAARSYDVMLFTHTDLRPLWLIRDANREWKLEHTLRGRDFERVPPYGASTVRKPAQVLIYGAAVDDPETVDLQNFLTIALEPADRELEGEFGNLVSLRLAAGQLYETVKVGRDGTAITISGPAGMTLGQVSGAVGASDVLTVVAEARNPAAPVEPVSQNLVESDAILPVQAKVALHGTGGNFFLIELGDVLNSIGESGNAWGVHFIVRLYTADFRGVLDQAGDPVFNFDLDGTAVGYDALIINDYHGPPFEAFRPATEQEGDLAASGGTFHQDDFRTPPNVGISISQGESPFTGAPTTYVTVDMIRVLYDPRSKFVSNTGLSVAHLTGSEFIAFPSMRHLQNVLSASSVVHSIEGARDLDALLFDLATVQRGFARSTSTAAPGLYREQIDTYSWSRPYLAASGNLPAAGLQADANGQIGVFPVPVQREQWEFEGGRFAGGSDEAGVLITGQLIKQFGGGSDSAEGGQPSFGEALGWPRAAAFHQGRLFFAGSRSLPNAYWASVSGDVLDFDATFPDEPDYGVFQLARGESRVVGWRHIFAGRHLQFLGDLAHGYIPVTGALTPTNIAVRINSSRGVEGTIPPIDIDGATAFVQRGGRSLRLSNFDEEEQAYRNESMSLYAPQMLDRPVDIDYRPGGEQGDTDTLHVVDAEGWIGTLAVDRTARVYAWSRWESHAKVRALTVLDADIWVVVEHQGKLAIARFDDEIELDLAVSVSPSGSDVSVLSPTFNLAPLIEAWNAAGGCSLILDDKLYPGPFMVTAAGRGGVITRANYPELPVGFTTGEAGLRWPTQRSERGDTGGWRVQLLPFVARGKAAGFNRKRRIVTAETDFPEMEEPGLVWLNGQSLAHGQELKGLAGHSKRAQVDIVGERRAELVSISYGVAV